MYDDAAHAPTAAAQMLATAVMQEIVRLSENAPRYVVGIEGDVGIAVVGPNCLLFTKAIFPGVLCDMILNSDAELRASLDARAGWKSVTLRSVQEFQQRRLALVPGADEVHDDSLQRLRREHRKGKFMSTVSIESARSALRATASTALAQALITGISEVQENGGTITQNDQIHLTKMAIMAYEDVLKACEALDVDAMVQRYREHRGTVTEVTPNG